MKLVIIIALCASSSCALFGSPETRLSTDKSSATYTWLSVKPGKRITGVLALFHGCKGTDHWWFKMPEGNRVVAHAQEQGLVCIAFRANNGEHKCWSDFPSERRTNPDIVRVRTALDAFLGEHHWESQLLYGLGASSGGSFISLLSRYYKFKAITIMISPGVASFATNDYGTEKVPERVAFIYMSEDNQWATADAIFAVKERLHTTAPHTKTIDFAVTPAPLTASVLQDRLGVTRADADAMMRAARTGAFVDQNDMVRNNPRQSAMVTTLASIVTGANTLDVPLRDALEELLNRLFAHHEMTSTHWTTALAFMMGVNDNEL